MVMSTCESLMDGRGITWSWSGLCERMDQVAASFQKKSIPLCMQIQVFTISDLDPGFST